MVFTKIGVIILILIGVLSACCLGSLIINFILMKKSLKNNLANYTNYCMNFNASLTLISLCIKMFIGIAIYFVVLKFIIL